MNCLYVFSCFGTQKQMLEGSVDCLLQAGKGLAKSYKRLLLTVNSRAEFPISFASDVWGERGVWLCELGDQYASEPHLLKKHFVSRGIYTTYFVYLLIIRIVQCAVGCIAALGSLYSYGHFPRLNQVAYDGLQFPRIVLDLFHLAVKWISPTTNVLFAEPF